MTTEAAGVLLRRKDRIPTCIAVNNLIVYRQKKKLKLSPLFDFNHTG